MKKTAAVVLLLALVLSGCGNPSSPATQEKLPDLNADAENIRNMETGTQFYETETQFYDDEYVTIAFLGIESRNTSQYSQYIVFYVTNKTNYTLSFQSDALAVDGVSLGHIIGDDRIAPDSKGKIRFATQDDLPTKSPKKISGEIIVVDYSRELLEKSYKVSFVNVDVS